MKTTKHAMKQAQRRGINSEAIGLVLAYGESVQAGRGCSLYQIQRKEMQYLEKECPKALWRKYQDMLRHVAMVVDDTDQIVITAMHRQKAIRKNWRCWQSKQRSR